MKTQLLIPVISLTTLTVAAVPSLAETTSPQAATSTSETIFRCDMSEGALRTLVMGMSNDEGDTGSPLINWSEQYFNSPDDALSVCQEVSKELQSLYESEELTTLTFVSQKVDANKVAVCFESETETGCEVNQAQYLFSLNTDKSAQEALYEVIGVDFKPPRTRGDFPTKMKVLDFSWFGN